MRGQNHREIGIVSYMLSYFRLAFDWISGPVQGHLPDSTIRLGGYYVRTNLAVALLEDIQIWGIRRCRGVKRPARLTTENLGAKQAYRPRDPGPAPHWSRTCRWLHKRQNKEQENSGKSGGLSTRPPRPTINVVIVATSTISVEL